MTAANIKTCPVCGQDFVAKRGKIYCSTPCQVQNNLRRQKSNKSKRTHWADWSQPMDLWLAGKL